MCAWALGSFLSLRGWNDLSVELAAFPEVWSSSSLSEMRSTTSIGAMVWLRFADHVAQDVRSWELVYIRTALRVCAQLAEVNLLYVEESVGEVK